ncbi:hypothetical protein PTKIN_Ptkin06aG0119600 [Pterospermum kingtungense]
MEGEMISRNSLESYISELQKLGTELIGLMEKALKIDKKEMIELVEDGRQAVRLAHYPPCPKPKWTLVSCELQPRCLCSQRGRQMFSNGVYHNIEHKVSANAKKQRMSVVFSMSPKFEANIRPLPTLINPNNPPLFRKLLLHYSVLRNLKKKKTFGHDTFPGESSKVHGEFGGDGRVSADDVRATRELSMGVDVTDELSQGRNVPRQSQCVKRASGWLNDYA